MPTILCIDDHEAGLQALQAVLETNGYAVLTASDGITGLALLDSRFDAVILDYRMEKMDGEVVAIALKQLRPSLPILMFSGYHSEIPDRVLRLVDVFVAKDEPVPTLLSALREMTGGTPAGDE
jgi:CheY-like chemotaxis protein